MLPGSVLDPEVPNDVLFPAMNRLIKGADGTKKSGRKQRFGDKNRIKIVLVNCKGEKEKQTEGGKI